MNEIDWRAQFVEVSAMRYMDGGLMHDLAYAAAEQDARVIEMFGQTVALVPVPVKEGA